ncbi:MAG TPA: hypothetical protein VFJ16_22775 [Longimicrobium sp.]|nr:hypothetical protein [Longimicrobium sp.]
MTAPGERPPGERALPIVLRFTLAMLLGLAAAFAHLAWSCRRPHSEACVWGKSLAIIGVPIETGVVGFGIFGVWMLVRWARREGRAG